MAGRRRRGRGARHLGATSPERPRREAVLSKTLEGPTACAVRHRDRSAGELRGGESRCDADRLPSPRLAPEQPGRELAPTRSPAGARAATVQEPAARGALLFRLQYGRQPVSAWLPCALGPQLSHVDAPALAGMGRRLRDNSVRYRSVRSRPKRTAV